MIRSRSGQFAEFFFALQRVPSRLWVRELSLLGFITFFGVARQMRRPRTADATTAETVSTTTSCQLPRNGETDPGQHPRTAPLRPKDPASRS
jgi:hypothetical protein